MSYNGKSLIFANDGRTLPLKGPEDTGEIAGNHRQNRRESRAKSSEERDEKKRPESHVTPRLHDRRQKAHPPHAD